MSKRIAIAEADADNGLPDSAFMAALLHDIGKLVLGVNLPQEYRAAMALAKNEGIPGYEAEKTTFGASHAEVGAYLVGLWGLPSLVVEALAFHHNPMSAPTKNLSTLTAVHVANALEHASRGESGASMGAGIDNAYLAELGLGGHVQHWTGLLDEVAAAQESGSTQ